MTAKGGGGVGSNTNSCLVSDDKPRQLLAPERRAQVGVRQLFPDMKWECGTMAPDTVCIVSKEYVHVCVYTCLFAACVEKLFKP